jgi:Cu(I)/Ag(I) efflux system membrane protein CusA/SilA
MTVSVVMAALVPILWSTGVGSDISKPIAAPMIGGMITSTMHVLIITPVIFFIMKSARVAEGDSDEIGDDAVGSGGKQP